jgi:hypothetical protein
VLFINHLLGMPLHPGQIKYIEESHKRKTKINVLVPSNRWGKTSLAACLQIWYHFYKFGVPTGNSKSWYKAAYRTANVAPRSSLVEPVFNYIDAIMTSTFPINLPDGRLVTNKCQIPWFYLKDQTRENPVHKQFFAFNSYIEHRTLGATAADSLEGKPFGLITYDEGGRSMHLEQEVNGTILARLFDWDGPFHIISTPDQTSPSILYHYELYQQGLHGINNTYTMEGSLRDNIFFPKEQIDKQYETYKNNPLRDQVLEGKFVFGGDNVFNHEDILDAKDHDLNDGKRRIDGHTYIIASDTSIGSDEIVHSVLDITNLHITKEGQQIKSIEGHAELVKQKACKGNSKSPQAHLNDFIDLYDSYSTEDEKPEYILETWNGESVRWYHDLPEYIKLKTHCYGSWQPEKRRTDNKNPAPNKTKDVKKADILLALSKLLSAKAIKIFAIDPNPIINAGDEKKGADLAQQMSIYKLKDDNLPTDRVLSLAFGCWLAMENAQKQEAITWFNM